MRRGWVLLAAIAAFGACKGASDWMRELDADPLFSRAAVLSKTDACATLVPVEFGRSIPIPRPDGGFEVFFYPTAVSAKGAALLPPNVLGQFKLDAQGAERCIRLPGSSRESLGPVLASPMTLKSYYRAQVRLYRTLGKAAELYGRRAEPGLADRLALREFVSVFSRLAEPGLLPYYYKANPDFWEWLRKRGGASITPA